MVTPKLQALRSLEHPAVNNGLALRTAASLRPNSKPARRIKVVFLIRSLGVGGAERQLVELAKRLDPNVFEVAVLCFYSEGAFVNELLTAGVPVLSLQKKGRWEICRFLVRLARELREQRPDILHGYLTGPNLVAVLMKPFLSSTRIVWGIRASKVETENTVERLLARLESLLSSRASLTIVNSWAGLDYCRCAGFAEDRCIVVPNGIDIMRFSPDRAAGAKQRTFWGIRADSLVIGLVGRIDPMKGHPTFLRAAAIFAKSRPDARFVCIGGGPESYLRELRALAGKLAIEDKIVWTGIIDDMPAAYSALDICCSSSAFGEGTPNCVAEAMACGVPCVVTDVGDSRIVVGETGFVVPRDDPPALAAGLQTMAGRITRDAGLGEAARDRIVSGFSLSGLVDKTSEAFRLL